jgi:hypothetical protein
MKMHLWRKQNRRIHQKFPAFLLDLIQKKDEKHWQKHEVPRGIITLTVGVQAERQEQGLPGFFSALSQSLKEIQDSKQESTYTWKNELQDHSLAVLMPARIRIRLSILRPIHGVNNKNTHLEPTHQSHQKQATSKKIKNKNNCIPSIPVKVA